MLEIFIRCVGRLHLLFIGWRCYILLTYWQIVNMTSNQVSKWYQKTKRFKSGQIMIADDNIIIRLHPGTSFKSQAISVDLLSITNSNHSGIFIYLSKRSSLLLDENNGHCLNLYSAECHDYNSNRCIDVRKENYVQEIHILTQILFRNPNDGWPTTAILIWTLTTAFSWLRF